MGCRIKICPKLDLFADFDMYNGKQRLQAKYQYRLDCTLGEETTIEKYDWYEDEKIEYNPCFILKQISAMKRLDK